MEFCSSEVAMLLSHPRRPTVSNIVFGITVVVLLAVAAGGFFLYGTRPAMEETTTVTSSDTVSHSSTSSAMNDTAASAIAFATAHGQMFGEDWLLVAPLGNGSYAVSLHATGLESASMGDYIVEAAQNSGQMAMVPIAGTNATQSEFTADSHGGGQFFAVLHQKPSSIYESVSIAYLPGVEMQNATVVATAPLTM
jgi:hypothetical protein